jgi:DNA polymerase-3 subunit epsilon
VNATEGPDSPFARAYGDARLPAPATPWRRAIFSVVDLELTGLDPVEDEIVSFATVTVEGGRIKLGDAIHRLVCPRRMPDAKTIRIHGLRESDLRGAPSLDQLLDELLAALTGRVLVAHVAPVEVGFLRRALAARGLELRNPVVDTALLAEELRRLQRKPPLTRELENEAEGASSPGLSRLARSLGLPVHRPHHADGDALTTAQVFLALASHLEEFGAVTVGSLERQSKRRQVQSALKHVLSRLIGRFARR